MLLSLLKILFFFGIVLAATLGAVHLAETGKVLRIVFDGVEYSLQPLQALALVALLVIAGWLIVQLLRFAVAFMRFLAGDETAIDRYFWRIRERKGYQALADGMLAVASGEGRLAQDKAARAAKFLNQPHVTNLLAAQAAEVAHEPQQAERVYRDMLADSRTRFVGVRGLMNQRLQAGDTTTALQLAQKAYALKPSHVDLQDTLLALQTREHDWKGARSVLKDKRRQGALPKDVHLRRDAVLALQEAREVLAHGNSISAREAAISANRASPDLVPAAVLASRSYLAQKNTRHASRVLEKAWGAQPHPALAAAYAEIVPDETPAQRLRRFDALIRQSPTHEETRLLQAELMLAAEDFPGARRALGDIAEKHPTVRSLSIMAAVERGEGADDSVVRGWLARALTASRGPQWVCDKCHNIMADWSPVCDSCGGFDTLSWREPPSDIRMASAGNSVTMLPLIIGRPTGSEDHVDRTFHEADAYAEGSDSAARHLPDPGRMGPGKPQPGEVDHRPPVEPAADRRPAIREVAQVAPGMVPRESDYAPPSATITDPEIVLPPAAPPPGNGQDPSPDVQLNGHPVGQPPKAADAEAEVAGGTAGDSRQIDLGDPPVRPDVEPGDDTVHTSRR
ncbi:heme biosynthesis HemY N-terminal domain-containing protein [uncultured Paracoccus sp.]|uniref:heme biosynthesis protein HemY n=1 Tax=uncultured Paracoccus sp. TaxID=189685 RepID=UPI002635C88B|nr:heme biosynthesis HemY N-terminal domain-containing protein [uncultured Paracoccus sp.]